MRREKFLELKKFWVWFCLSASSCCLRFDLILLWCWLLPPYCRSSRYALLFINFFSLKWFLHLILPILANEVKSIEIQFMDPTVLMLAFPFNKIFSIAMRTSMRLNFMNYCIISFVSWFSMLYYLQVFSW